MPTVQKRNLTNSSSGCPILIAATATGADGTVIHTATSGTGVTIMDEIWLYAFNAHTATATLTVQWGSSAAANNIKVTLPAAGSGLVPIAPGLLLNDTAVLRAFASTTNVIACFGFVNRITD
jgi:hypothetical protein